MSNDRHNDFLGFALQRILEAATLYETQAKLCRDQSCKFYLYYLAAKKRVQYVLLEQSNHRTAPAGCDSNCFTIRHIVPESTELSLLSVTDINLVVRRMAEQEFNLFIDLASFEEDCQTKKLLIHLSKMAKAFINDISTGYSLFSFKHKALKIPSMPKRVLPVLAQA